MKRVELPSCQHFNFSVPVDGSWASSRIEPDEVQAQKDQCRRVVESALCIESILNIILMKGVFRELRGSRDFVDKHLMNSNHFSFASKKYLLKEFLRNTNLLSGSQKSALDEQLAKVIKYRNAFAHGTLIEKEIQMFISYFHSDHKEECLDDAFWEQLEKAFRGASDALDELLNKIPPITVHFTDFPLGQK
jgi:hypothetical protein